MERMLAADEAKVRKAVGAQTYQRGVAYAREGLVRDVTWDDERRVVSGVVSGSSPRPYLARVAVVRAASGALASLAGTCTCPVGANCKHTVALLVTALPRPPREPRSAGTAPSVPAWQHSLDALIGHAGPGGGAQPEFALQFEADGADRPGRVSIRPVVQGKAGWIRTGVSWANLSRVQYSRSPGAKRIHALLSELVALHTLSEAARYSYYSYLESTFDLASFGSRRLWDVLAELSAAGLPFLQAGRPPAPVVLRESVRAVVDVRATQGGMWVGPRLLLGEQPIEPHAVQPLGSPAHGLAWREPGDGALHLAPLPASPGADAIATLSPLVVPAGERSRFLATYLPRLRRMAAVLSSDDSVQLPEPEPPRLQLSVEQLDTHEIRVRWSWSYRILDTAREEPLWPADPFDAAARDLDAELSALSPAEAAARKLPSLFDDGRLAAQRELAGMATVRFLSDVLPAVSALEDVDTHVSGAVTDYHESTAAPVIAFNVTNPDERDWLDLDVCVSVDGEQVPFVSLFTALAQGEPYVILPSGTYFAVDRPEYAALAALIAESRALFDAEPGTVRLGRLQAGMWDELERIGVVGAQAEAWRGAARALSAVSSIPEHPVPSTLCATLRGYQVDGFHWLAFLYEHGLGGVLADEMGLGKTLQALALICQVREQGHRDAPFLVVAPTSVVHNWVAECHRFAPHLTVRAVTETRKRRGADLADVACGADVVVTSYTLFRLEHEQYSQLPWAGLIADEAQFLKNHQSLAYRCAKKLDTPFKLAITGTPMENNLMELWSLMSITAPGLFPHPRGFQEYYRWPIEKERDAECLDRLRRRVRPLMLRRTKGQVVADLPEKQEQVLELDLNPRHRQAYQTQLHRERQKVLGLLGDLEKNRFQIFRSLTVLRQASLDIRLVDPERSAVPSSKLDALLDHLAEVTAEGHRAVVFSQFTRFLDLARQRLDAAGIGYAYLDGRTKRRSAAIQAFKDGTAPAFLISLKAGGFGLNLTEADYCFILDPWWNPAAEAQAVDRLHRIGQTRRVMVYRFVARETIEEKVMALKAGKSALFASVMDAEAGTTSRLSAADIRGLIE